MLYFLKDKYLLEPMVNKSDFLYTIFNLNPNKVTLINFFIILKIILIFYIYNYFYLALFFMNIRAWLDGVDGYIARKYQLLSKEGEILDHVSDTVFLGSVFTLFFYHLNIPIFVIIPLCHTGMLFAMICNFIPEMKFIGNFVFGAGGGYESYSLVITNIFHVLLHSLIYYMQ